MNKPEIEGSPVRNKAQGFNDRVLPDILRAIREISYGSVQIHIQDGKIVQIDKIKKLRML